MAKLTKRQQRKRRDWRNSLGDIANANGKPFKLRNTSDVWFILTVVPMVAASGTAASAVIGFTVWAPALFIAAALAMVAWPFFWGSYTWLETRGWGDAIVEIEEKRRKAWTYGSDV